MFVVGSVRAPPAHSGTVAPGVGGVGGGGVHSLPPPHNISGSVHPLFGPPANQPTLMSPRQMTGMGGMPLGGPGGLDASGMTSHPSLTISNNHHAQNQSIVVPTPTRTRTIKSYHCRMCDQVSDVANCHASLGKLSPICVILCTLSMIIAAHIIHLLTRPPSLLLPRPLCPLLKIRS